MNRGSVPSRTPCDPRSFLHSAQDERDLLLTEFRLFGSFFPSGSIKTFLRIFSQWVIQLPGSRSILDLPPTLRAGHRSRSNPLSTNIATGPIDRG